MGTDDFELQKLIMNCIGNSKVSIKFTDDGDTFGFGCTISQGDETGDISVSGYGESLSESLIEASTRFVGYSNRRVDAK